MSEPIWRDLAETGYGPANIARLSEAVRRVCAEEPFVRAAFVFGSQATGTSSPDSDIDIGVWLAHYPEPSRLNELQDRLAHQIGEAMGRHDVDLVILNSANPLLRHNATDAGIAAYERAPGDAGRVGCVAWKEWLDQSRFWDGSSERRGL